MPGRGFRASRSAEPRRLHARRGGRAAAWRATRRSPATATRVCRERRARQPRCSPRSRRRRCSPTASLSVAAIALALLVALPARAEGAPARSTSWARSSRPSGSRVLTPLLAAEGSHYLWEGPTVPVLGPLALTGEELEAGLLVGAAPRRGRARLRRLRAAARPRPARAGGRLRAPLGARRSRSPRGSCRRSSATPAGCSRPCAGAGSRSQASRGHARLLSPLLAGSLERGLNLAEAMEARGYGRPGRDPRAAPARPLRPAGARRWPRRSCWRGRCGSSDRRARSPSRIRTRSPPCGTCRSTIEPGEAVLVLGPSGSGKSTLLRALAGLVPHFHGGRFAGRVEVLGRDTRRTRPAELAGGVATLFQDPEDQVVMAARRARGRVRAREPRRAAARDRRPRRATRSTAVGAGAPRRARRPTSSRAASCSASARRRRSRCGRELLLLDEPTSQLDPDGARRAARRARSSSGAAVVVSEHRPERLLDAVDRVLFLEGGRRRCSTRPPARRAPGSRASGRPGSSRRRSRPSTEAGRAGRRARARCRSRTASEPRVDGVDLELRRGEVVALTGPERLRQDDAREARGRAARAGGGSRSPLRPGGVPLAGSRPLPHARPRRRRGRARDRRRPRPGARVARRSSGLAGLEAPAPARPLERRARAARAGGGPRRRARPARPRRADARRRSRAQGRAGRAPAGGSRRAAPRSSSRTTKTSPPRVADRTVSLGRSRRDPNASNSLLLARRAPGARMATRVPAARGQVTLCYLLSVAAATAFGAAVWTALEPDAGRALAAARRGRAARGRLRVARDRARARRRRSRSIATLAGAAAARARAVRRPCPESSR